MRDRQHDRLKGEVIGGYRLGEVIGIGSYSAVYRAEHTELGSCVAIKVLDPKMAKDGVSLRRFIREAKVTANLEHPNIVKVYSIGELEGFHYITMYLAEKGPLDLVMQQSKEKRFSPDRSLTVLRDVLSGLAAAHESGQLHRDIKAKNIVFASDDRAMLCDFGLARMEEDHTMTATREVLGTPYYLAPECFTSSRNASKSSDVWSCGVLLYFMVDGTPPFGGTAFLDVAKAVQYSEPDFSEITDKRALKLLRSLLIKDPAKRPQDARAALRMLNKVAPPDGKVVDIHEPGEVQGTDLQEILLGSEALRSEGDDGLRKCADYLRRFPDGADHDAIRKRFDKFEAELWKRTKAAFGTPEVETVCDDYLDAVGSLAPAAHREEAEEMLRLITADDMAWEAASTASSPGPVTGYLDAWEAKHGRHVEKARKRLASFDDTLWDAVLSRFTRQIAEGYLAALGNRGTRKAQVERLLAIEPDHLAAATKYTRDERKLLLGLPKEQYKAWTELEGKHRHAFMSLREQSLKVCASLPAAMRSAYMSLVPEHRSVCDELKADMRLAFLQLSDSHRKVCVELKGNESSFLKLLPGLRDVCVSLEPSLRVEFLKLTAPQQMACAELAQVDRVRFLKLPPEQRSASAKLSVADRTTFVRLPPELLKNASKLEPEALSDFLNLPPEQRKACEGLDAEQTGTLMSLSPESREVCVGLEVGLRPVFLGADQQVRAVTAGLDDKLRSDYLHLPDAQKTVFSKLPAPAGLQFLARSAKQREAVTCLAEGSREGFLALPVRQQLLCSILSVSAMHGFLVMSAREREACTAITDNQLAEKFVSLPSNQRLLCCELSSEDRIGFLGLPKDLAKWCAELGPSGATQFLSVRWLPEEKRINRLFEAAKSDNADAIKALSLANTPLDTRDPQGRTPLSHAAQANATMALAALIDLHADLNAKDSAGMTPLHHAAKAGAAEAVVALVSAGVKLYIRTRPLVGSIPYDYGKELPPDVRKLLVRPTEEVVALRAFKVAMALLVLWFAGWLFSGSILDAAVAMNSPTLARGAVLLGADLTEVDGQGLSPMHHAAIARRFELLATMARLLEPDVSRDFWLEVVALPQHIRTEIPEYSKLPQPERDRMLGEAIKAGETDKAKALAAAGARHNLLSCESVLPAEYAPLSGLFAGSREAQELQKQWVSKGFPLEVRLKGTDIRLRLIPPGEFMMGSGSDDGEAYSDEKPQHKVTISKPFYMAVTEITQAQWQKVMNGNPSNWKGEDLPVERVSWNDCQGFIKELRKVAPGLRFPTEAEWEYACRAGTTQSRYGELDAIAWYDDNSGGKTHPVAGKLPNAFGLYDMLGNVWEWCEDNWHDSYNGAPADGKAWLGGNSARVLRGGGWSYGTRSCRSASRNGIVPDGWNTNDGFRVALDLP